MIEDLIYKKSLPRLRAMVTVVVKNTYIFIYIFIEKGWVWKIQNIWFINLITKNDETE